MRRKSKALSATAAASTGTTRARRTMFGLACLCVLGLIAFTGSSAPSVAADEAFPGQGFLPDNRAWEMVSPPDKSGGDVLPMSSRTRAAADGDAIEFGSLVGFGNPQGSSVATEYIAERTAAPGSSGWETHAITPKQPPLSLTAAANSLEPKYDGEMSADLSHGVYVTPSQLPGFEVPAAANNVNFYRRDNLREAGTGGYLLLSKPFALPPASLFLPGPYLAGASESFSNVIFESTVRLTEDAPESETKLYESEEGGLRLAGRIPASGTECDDDAGPACEAAASSQAGLGARGEGGTPHRTPHMVSADGSRVFFQAPINTGNVYMREDGQRTVKLNVSEKAVPESPQGASLFDASASGDRVFFATGEGLVEGDEDGSTDIYMAEPDAPAGQRLTLVSVDGETADTDAVVDVVGASEDGRYLYFAMHGQLVEGEPVNGLSNRHLYLWHDGAISYIGEFADGGEASIGNGLRGDFWPLFSRTSKARVAPDGRHLLFYTSDSSGFQGHGGFSGYDQGCGTGTCRWEQFLYSADSGQLRCATCNVGSVPTANVEINTKPDLGTSAVQSTTHLSHALSDDGRFVFFNTSEALVPEDVNGKIDAYEYEAASEEIHLLSSGTSGADSYFLDAGADGSDVFIVTRDKLSGWDVDTSYDLYDARIDGGLPEPTPPPPSCQGDACQPAPARLNDSTPASSAYAGPGNARASRGCRAAAKRLQKLNRQAKLLRHRSASAADPSEQKQLRQKAKRISDRAGRIGSQAKRCRAGRKGGSK